MPTLAQLDDGTIYQTDSDHNGEGFGSLPMQSEFGDVYYQAPALKAECLREKQRLDYLGAEAVAAAQADAAELEQYQLSLTLKQADENKQFFENSEEFKTQLNYDATLQSLSLPSYPNAPGVDEAIQQEGRNKTIPLADVNYIDEKSAFFNVDEAEAEQYALYNDATRKRTDELTKQAYQITETGEYKEPTQITMTDEAVTIGGQKIPWKWIGIVALGLLILRK